MTHELPNGIRVMWVEVPEGATELRVTGKKINELIGYCRGTIWSATHCLPEGNWTLLGRFEDITEDQWKGIVPKIDGRVKLKPYPDYEFIGSSCWTATESARSLLGPGNMVVLIDNSKNVRV